MLFHYSDDIVKAPVHNTQTLLEEYVDTEKDVVKGKMCIRDSSRRVCEMAGRGKRSSAVYDW